MTVLNISHNKQVIVDKEDYDYLCKFNWYLNCNGYAIHRVGPRGKAKTIFIHRLITNCPEGLFVDHINGDKLDNTKCNLRICTHKNNLRNQKVQTRKKTSKYKGVYLHSDKKKWVARIKVNKKDIYLGMFTTQEDAAIAYNKAALQHFKEYASLNKVVHE